MANNFAQLRTGDRVTTNYSKQALIQDGVSLGGSLYDAEVTVKRDANRSSESSTIDNVMSSQSMGVDDF